MKRVYLIGSLRNPAVPKLAAALRAKGYEVFDDWYAAGPEADDKWQEYEKQRGSSYQEALDGRPASQVFDYDKANLDRADVAVMLMPAGKSAHLELGYFIGKGKPGFIALPEEPERFDVMYKFANAVCTDFDQLVASLETVVVPR